MLRRCFTLNLNKNNKYLTLSRYESTQDKALKQQKVEEGIPKEPQNYGMTDRVINTSKSDKYMIKWFGKTKYKSVDDVPDQIPSSTYVFVKDQARAKTSVFLVILVLIGAFATVQLGKHDREAGINRLDRGSNENRKH